MRTKLTKTFTQLTALGADESHLEICIDFDTISREVLCLNYIRSYSVITRQFTDITHILFNYFHDQLDSMIESINWLEEYKSAA